MQEYINIIDKYKLNNNIIDWVRLSFFDKKTNIIVDSSWKFGEDINVLNNIINKIKSENVYAAYGVIMFVGGSWIEFNYDEIVYRQKPSYNGLDFITNFDDKFNIQNCNEFYSNCGFLRIIENK